MENSFYLIDKPLKYSSFDIIRVLKKKLNIKRIGHSGTLDPLATGGLLIAIGKYTKLINFLEKDKKTYEFELSLDGVTDSFDLAEEIKFLDKHLQKKFKKELSIQKIQDFLNKYFLGEIYQVPPKYSALKINGVRAYKMARQGKDFELKKRKINIYNIEILKYDYPKLSLRAEVSSGTYIRSIASDLGQITGTGAYITKLRRTKIGNLDLSYSQNLEDFDEKKIIDLQKVFTNIEFINLEDEILQKIDNGLSVRGKFDYKQGEFLFVIKEQKITNIVVYDGEKIIPKKKL